LAKRLEKRIQLNLGSQFATQCLSIY
jgi:hypothetical protein